MCCLPTHSQLVIRSLCVQGCAHINSPFEEPVDYLVLQNQGESDINLYEWSISNGEKKPKTFFQNNSYSTIPPHTELVFFLHNTPNVYSLPFSLAQNESICLYYKDSLCFKVKTPSNNISGEYYLNESKMCFLHPDQVANNCLPATPIDKTVNFGEIHISAEEQKIQGPRGVLSATQKNEQVSCCLDFYLLDTLVSSLAYLSAHSPDGDAQKSIELDLIPHENGELAKLPFEFLSESPRTFVLRNGGEDGLFMGKSGLRNSLAASVFNSIPASRKQQHPMPIHVHINQKHCGLYWIYEKINEHALTNASDVLKRSSKIITSRKAFKGSWNNYLIEEEELLQLSSLDPQLLTKFSELWDLEHYIAYHFYQQLIGNQDRYSNNIKMWKSKKDYRWRYLLWDLDWAYGRWKGTAPSGDPSWNALQFSLSDGAGWTNESETKLFQHLMSNPDFRDHFVMRSCDCMNFECSPQVQEQNLDSLIENLDDQLEAQFTLYIGNANMWEKELEQIKLYIKERPLHHFAHLVELIKDSLVQVQLSPKHHSSTLINTHIYKGEQLTYPSSSLLQLLPAVSSKGEFTMWSDSVYTLSRWLSCSETLPYPIYSSSGGSAEVKISNINTHSSLSQATEYIEISNLSHQPLLLDGYKLSDQKGTLTFRSGDFIEAYSSIKLEQLPFALNKEGEVLYLRNRAGELIDYWDYTLHAFLQDGFEFSRNASNTNEICHLSVATLIWISSWMTEVELYTSTGVLSKNISKGLYFLKRDGQCTPVMVVD